MSVKNACHAVCIRACLAVCCILLLLLSACASAPHSPSGNVRFGGGNGDSLAEAIVIKGAANEAIGVAAEYSWVRKNLPGWTLAGQEVVTKGRKVYDLMKVRSAAGEERTIYFDISDFYGKIF